MSISSFPRRGKAIAPKTLRDLLDISIPVYVGGRSGVVTVRLSSLDETVWSRYGRRTCNRMAEVVVEYVRNALQSLPSHVASLHLPRVPANLSLDDLELESRTYNSLLREGLGSPQWLGDWTVGQIIRLRGFGAKCLIDLLTSLEANCMSMPAVAPEMLSDVQAPRGYAEEKDETLLTELTELSEIEGSEFVDVNDPRFGRMLRATGTINGTLSDLIQRLNARPESLGFKEAAAARDLILQMKDSLRLTLEAESLALMGPNRRNAEIGRRRWGLDGGDSRTLQEVGDEYGLTRERVRQLCDRIHSSLEGKTPFAPSLGRALGVARTMLPGPAEGIEQRLLEEGLTEPDFRLEGLERAARLFGREPGFMIAIAGSGRVVLPPGQAQSLDPAGILRVARRSIEHWGVATVSDVSANVSGAEASVPADEAVTRALLTLEKGFEWLDEEDGWFWLRSVGRNRLLNQVTKVMSVAPRITIGELREGARRHHRMKGVSPPRRVLLELCRQAGQYRVEGDVVIADPAPDWQRVLSENERIMFRVLTSAGPVMQRERLEDLCVGQGMNRSTFYIYLGYSPIIAQYARGVYGIRGAEVPPGMIEALIPKRRPSKVLMDFGWTDDRELWLGYRLSNAAVTSGVISIPSSVKKFLQGSFSLSTSDGSRVGTLVARDSSAWGLHPFFSRRGGDEGDYLLLVFNLDARSATATIGDASLLEEFQV